MPIASALVRLTLAPALALACLGGCSHAPRQPVPASPAPLTISPETRDRQPAPDLPASLVRDARTPALSVGVSDMEFLGPLAGWVNVKSDLGAVGDGVADDTLALQRGLDALRKFDAASGPVGLYLPAGTYRITRTLTLSLKTGINLVGEDPVNTVVAWDGDRNGTMLLASGSFDVLFTHLTWDGRGQAGIGVAQWWNFRTDRANYQGSIKHIDETFLRLGIGIYGGRLGNDYGQGDSETLIERVDFRSMSVAGVNLGSFNALNWWIWDSRFVDCARGVTNEFSVDDRGPTPGAGNFLVYRSVFVGSTVADASLGNTGWFSLHNNVSVGSRQFLHAAPLGPNGGALIVQNNRIVDTLDPVSIDVGNEGPLILVDNQIRSRTGTRGPVVRLTGLGTVGERQSLSLGNQYTVEGPIAVGGIRGRLLSYGDTRLEADLISTALPALPGAATNFHRRVFEVAPNASARQIQAAIDAAAASRLDGAVVHIPAGTYAIDHVLVVPARARIQLAGDSMASVLSWTGIAAAPGMLRLAGPSYATVRDLRFIGRTATAIEMPDADQADGRVFIEGANMAPMKIFGLLRTRIDARANTGLGAIRVDRSRSVLAIGGGLGPVQLEGNSTMLAADSWYEGDLADLFRGDSGTFTYLGGLMAPFSHGIRAGFDASAPAISLDGFSGRASFIGLGMDLGGARKGIRFGAPGGGMSALFVGVSANASDYMDATSSPDVGLLMASASSRDGVTTEISDRGRVDGEFVLQGFRQARSVVWEAAPWPQVSGVTDVRIFRVATVDTLVGLDISR